MSAQHPWAGTLRKDVGAQVGGVLQSLHMRIFFATLPFQNFGYSFHPVLDHLLVSYILGCSR